jgi:hypothetical protein
MNRECKVLKHTIIVILETHSWQQGEKMKKSHCDNFFAPFFQHLFPQKKRTKFHSMNGSSFRLTQMAPGRIEKDICIF